MRKNITKLYELFHKNTNPLKIIPDKNNFTYHEIFKFIDSAQGLIGKKKLSVLDIGCGAGQISFYLANQGHNIHGIDISQKAVTTCKQTAQFFNLPNARFYVKNIEKNSISGKYDLIILSELIEHIKNDHKIIKKLQKNLNKNGLLLITTPSDNAPLYRLGLLDEFDQRVGHIRRYNPKSLRQLLTSNGYEIISLVPNEGILRNSLYNFKIGSWPLKVIHRIIFLGRLITRLDKLSMKLFGESDYFVLAKKSQS
jgi:2-polyprenyl-3-methyl-5-hydroxy-6-metoxy-1,4-benzoquinol methylase